MNRGISGVECVGAATESRRERAGQHDFCGYRRRLSLHYLHDNQWSSHCTDCECRHAAAVATAGAGLPHVVAAESHPRNRPPARKHIPGAAAPHPRRVMLYSHDTYGLGHLRRNLAIARQLLASPAHFEVMLLTGSPMQSDWPLPTALTVRALPPVVKLGDEHYGPRDHRKNFTLLKGHREALILEAALSFRPDVFLVDHAPIGMGGELLPTLALLHEDRPETRLVLGMRDILDAPEATRRTWQEQGVPDILDRVYDDILIYGREDWFDAVAAYDIPAHIARKIRYCGYVCNDPAPEASLPVLPRVAPGVPRVLVTVGGGGDGCCVIEGYLEALRRVGGFGCQSLIVPGPLMDPAERARLERGAAACPDVHLIDGATDMLSLMRQCDLVISMAGYNTSVEILALGCRAILVPRARPRAEQRMRAEMLARFGFADRIDPDGDIAAQLAEQVPAALRAGKRGGARAPLDGAERVAAELDALTMRPPALLEA